MITGSGKFAVVNYMAIMALQRDCQAVSQFFSHVVTMRVTLGEFDECLQLSGMSATALHLPARCRLPDGGAVKYR